MTWTRWPQLLLLAVAKGLRGNSSNEHKMNQMGREGRAVGTDGLRRPLPTWLILTRGRDIRNAEAHTSGHIGLEIFLQEGVRSPGNFHVVYPLKRYKYAKRSYEYDSRPNIDWASHLTPPATTSLVPLNNSLYGLEPWFSNLLNDNDNSGLACISSML